MTWKCGINGCSWLIIDQDSDLLGKLFDHNGGLLRSSLRRIQLAAADEAVGGAAKTATPNDLKLGDHKMNLHGLTGRAALVLGFLGSLILICFLTACGMQRPKWPKQSWWRLSKFPIHVAWF